MIDYEIHTNTKIIDNGYLNNRKQFINDFYNKGDYPISIEEINNMKPPYFLNYSKNSISQNYTLSSYNDKSKFESNVVEFWLPLNNKILYDIDFKRYYVSSFGRTWDCIRNASIYSGYQQKGYIQIYLDSKNHKNKVAKKLHRVILLIFAYFDGCENYQVNHKNNIRDDNRLWNLEWVSPSQNSINRVYNNTNSLFGRGYDYILTDDIAYEILYLKFVLNYKKYDICKYLSNKYNLKITQYMVSNVINRREKRWVYDKFMNERSSTIEKHSEI